MSRTKDIKNQRYGHLIAIEPTDERDKIGNVIWKFNCDCGNTCFYTMLQIKSFATPSCGCETKRYKQYDIIGKRFGRLIVEEEAEKKNNLHYFNCKCDCGNGCVCEMHNLINGHIKSCGCLQNETRKENWLKDCKENTKLGNLNAKKYKNNTSGVKGVFYNKQRKKWEAFLYIKKTRIFLGRYDDIKEAEKARKVAEEKYFEPVLNEYGKELKGE